MCGLESRGSRYVPLTGSCGHGNEIPDFIQCGEYLPYLRSYKLGGRTQLHEVSYSNY